MQFNDVLRLKKEWCWMDDRKGGGAVCPVQFPCTIVFNFHPQRVEENTTETEIN